MKDIQRYAVYYAPRDGAFATAAAAWLGWDAARGVPVAHPDVGLPLADLTDQPRRYGFHATLRAPFRLTPGYEHEDLCDAVQGLANRLAPVVCDRLHLAELHGFLALTPIGAEADVNALAARVVEGTDVMRAPLTGDEITRRRPDTLTVRQRDLLHGWGYPFVMEEFRFHLTLSRQVPPDQMPPLRAAAEAHFGAVLPCPFVIEDLCLFGEDDLGWFHLLNRYPLSG